MNGRVVVVGGVDRRRPGGPGPPWRFAALYGEEALVGVVAVNWPRAVVAARRSLSAGVGVDGFARTLEA